MAESDRRSAWAGLVVVLAGLWLAGPALAAAEGTAYRLGVGDQVQLSVLQQADLDRELVVRPDGSVIVPLVGPVQVVGLTIPDAEELVKQKLRLFNREIGEVSLTVTQYNALKVTVLGAVTHPGDYTFQAAPNLWDAVRAAGGALASANLAAVRVVREKDGQASTQLFDISAIYVGQSSVAPAPLRPGDTVVVPSREETSASPSANTVQVIGAVLRPGSVTITEGTPLISVLLLAGGSLATSDLSTVQWVRAGAGGRGRASRIDMGDYFGKGLSTGNPLVQPGDTVHVPYRGEGFFRTIWPVLLSTITVGVAVYLANNRR